MNLNLLVYAKENFEHFELDVHVKIINLLMQ